jgi:hypothetical protein
MTIKCCICKLYKSIVYIYNPIHFMIGAIQGGEASERSTECSYHANR